jgi:DNA-binding HxlR family transcriptional regulator
MGLPLRKNRAAPPLCPLTECMNLLSGAWAPNVIWMLSAGPRRFGELRHDIPRVSARVLGTSPPSVEYQLTTLGKELVPAIQAIVAVGHKLNSAAASRRRVAKAA